MEPNRNEAIERSSLLATRSCIVLAVAVVLAPLSCVLLSDFDGLAGDAATVSDSGLLDGNAPEADATDEDVRPDGTPGEDANDEDAPGDGDVDATDAIADAAEEDALVSAPGVPVLVSAVQGHVFALLADGDDIFWTADEVVLGDGGLGSAVYKTNEGCQGGSCGTMTVRCS